MDQYLCCVVRGERFQLDNTPSPQQLVVYCPLELLWYNYGIECNNDMGIGVLQQVSEESGMGNGRYVVKYD